MTAHDRTSARPPIASALIAVITYRRPAELARFIESVLALESEIPWRLVVVDNDPHGSARTTVDRFGSAVQYAHEPKPGIAAARNRCISLIGPADDAIVFTDDDEVVGENWLNDLIACANAFDADVVGGPVRSVVPDDAPAWIRQGNFFQRRIRPTGSSEGLPATNNVLVRSSALRQRDQLRFDDRFSITGGSDTDFFARFIVGDVRFVWSSTAYVIDYLPSARLSFRWLFRRFTRGGETYARVFGRTRSKVRIALTGVAYMLAGLLIAPFAIFIRPALRGISLKLFARGYGFLRGIMGASVNEYARMEE
ncbi:Glycosyltransferase, GT2 family [Georgenia satyanarayanai]|uniref:Glycosyltransferase, GT2 family n=1 Tax=Georgenia satyanarayanai TaxID=860221 RepID=A0A2Y9APF4_9MICO|nr:glycosyltransferase family 2 protein [Georgenia satyanarayanai]PYF98343.1 GT2 family glycosyltransferase [Georgenia satyanarayanai]SSA45228.1 Glycosyltransferase, GT2 family [Georgenia satyanarayanai]